MLACSCFLKARQRSQSRTWRRTGGAELDQALGDLAELQADLLAAELARLGGLGEGDPGAHQQRLDARHGRLHRVGDLLVGERVDLAQHQRRALRLGQMLDVVDQLAELSRRMTFSLVDMPASAKWVSIESTPTAVARRRWLSERLRAIR